MTNRDINLGDPALVDEIVREVLARLGALARAKPAERAEATTDSLIVAGRVVSVASLDGRLNGARSVVLERGAVLTPAARDLLKAARVAVSYRAGQPQAAWQTLAVATAGTNYDPQPLVDAVAPGLAASERLAQTGLTSVVDELAAQIVKGGRFGLLLTGEVDAALCLANRLRGVRAIAAGEQAAVARGVAAVGANLLVFDPARQSFFQSVRAVAEFVRGGRRAAPAALAERLG